MKIIIAGATGLIGTPLVRQLLGEGHEVVVLSRAGGGGSGAVSLPGARLVAWRPPEVGAWASEIDGADAVVNLAGASVASTAWDTRGKALILSSRVDSTTALVGAIERAARRPRVLVNGSASGFYGSRGAEMLTEASARGQGFLADICVAWEAAARPAEALGVRVVLARTGVVLSGRGGALPLMALPFRFFVGGTPGDPNAWLAWIHLDDEVDLLRRAIDDDSLRGPVNFTAPTPVQMDTFAGALASALHRPALFPVPSVALRLVLGERYEGFFASQRIYPRAAEAVGYTFRYPEIGAALRAALSEGQPAGSGTA